MYVVFILACEIWLFSPETLYAIQIHITLVVSMVYSVLASLKRPLCDLYAVGFCQTANVENYIHLPTFAFRRTSWRIRKSNNSILHKFA